MDWEGTPVRDGSVSLTVSDRRPVGVFFERDLDESVGPSFFRFILIVVPLSANLPRRDSSRDSPIISFQLTLFSVMNRLHIIWIKLIQQLSEGEDGRI